MGKIILLGDLYPYELPPEPQLEKDILFAGLPVKDQYWRRTGMPTNWSDMSVKSKGKFIEEQVDKMFVTGQWFANKGELIYLPPSAFSYFNWCKMKDGQYPKFRYAQYYELLFEEFAEAISNCIGTYRFKKRRDGLTTRRMFRKVWKAIQPKYANSWCGLQSKTGTDAQDVCWETLMAGYKGLPSWVKPEQAGSSDPKTKLEFRTPATRLSKSNVKRIQEQTDTGLNTTIDYRDTVADAYDGQELLDLSLDEAAKWIKASVIKAFITYNKCVWKDGVKVGHIHAFSSPAQTNGRGHDESIAFWNMADPFKSLQFSEDGMSYEVIKKSWFILRYFTSALEGYGGACDQYGICDQDLAYELIKEEIANTPKEFQAEVERQLPMSIDDILSNTADSAFGSADEMNDRKIYLMGKTHKDLDEEEETATLEPKYIYGNLEWKDGIQDSYVVFKASKNQDEFSYTGRFCFQYFPPEDMQNGLIKKVKLQTTTVHCPEDAPSVIGIDPYDYRRTESKNISEGAALGGCALDFDSRGIKDRIWFAYQFRPKMPEDFFEDMIKACMYTTSYAQVEAKNKNIIDYFEDRGYFDVLLPKSITGNKEHKGNATTSNLTDEMMSLIDSFWGDPQRLHDFWMEFVLEDNLLFNPQLTTKYHLTMAQGQMHLGFVKRRLTVKKKPKRTHNLTLNERIANVIASQYGLD
jgi:hypothetical protein